MLSHFTRIKKMWRNKNRDFLGYKILKERKFDQLNNNSSEIDNPVQVNNITDIPRQEDILTIEISCQNIKFYPERPKKAFFTP